MKYSSSSLAVKLSAENLSALHRLSLAVKIRSLPLGGTLRYQPREYTATRSRVKLLGGKFFVRFAWSLRSHEPDVTPLSDLKDFVFDGL